MDKTAKHVPSTPLDVRLGLTKAEDVAYPLRWGILGAGEISRQWVHALLACAGATVTAVAARDEGRAKKFAEAHSINAWFGDYREMVNSPEVDIVFVGTIYQLHKEHVILAVNAGKHVLCEKPFSAHPEEALEMYAAASAADVMAQHGMWTRFFPAVEHARFAIDSGMIGDVLMVHADFSAEYTIPAALLAFGSESPDAMSVTGGSSVLEYANDRSAILSFPPYPSEFPEVVEFIGSLGRITLEQPAHCPTSIAIRVPEKTPSRYMNANTPAPVHRYEYPIPDTVCIPNAFPNQQGFIYQAEAVHRCLAAGLRECPQFTKKESLRVVGLVAEIQKNPKRQAYIQKLCAEYGAKSSSS